MLNYKEIDLEDWGMTHKEMDNELLEQFGYQHLENAIRILRTGIFTPEDGEVIHEVLCIVLSIYSRKLKTGEINKDIKLH